MSKNIQFIGVGTFAAANGASINLTMPANLKINDLLMLVIHTANEAITIPTGWTEVGNQANQAIGTATNQLATRLAVCYKWAAATNATVTVNAVGNILSGQSIAFRFVNKNNPFIATASGTQASSAANPTLNGITTTCPNALIFFALANGRDATATNSFSALTNANLNTITERMDSTSGNGTGGGVAAWTAYAALTGAIGNSTATKGVAVTDSTTHLTIGLRPKARRFSVS